MTTKERLAQLPDVPTIAESGFPGFELNEWNGLYAPSGTPAAVLERIREASVAALAQASVQARLANLGALAVGSSRGEFVVFLSHLRETMKALVAEANITLE